MANFLVIKKKSIINSLIAFVVVLLSFSFFISFSKNKNSVIATSNTLDSDGSLNQDFNGDGNIETLELSKEKDGYILKLKDKSKEYLLKPKDGGSILGNVLPNWPISVETIDLSRNGIPEIIVRSSKDGTSINHIFSWSKDGYTNIYSSNDNILGILDSTNTRTPKILSLSSKQGDGSTSAFIINGNKLKDISFSKPTVPGLGNIQSFIDTIEEDYEIDDPPNIFSSEISSTELSILWNLDKENTMYSFQNGYFTDISWDDSGNPSSLKWYLSFEKVSKTAHDEPKSELFLILTVTKDEVNEFRISSIKKS